MVVDSHHHLWRYDPAQLGWIDVASMSAIARDFLPEDLLAETRGAGVSAVVSVQAAQTIAETKLLLGFAEQTAEIAGVVGWAPLVARDIDDQLAALQHPLLKGVRHIVQDEPDDSYLLRDDFNRGVAALEKYDLAYDVLVFERQLPAAIEFVDRHPEQRFILDHLAKPRIADGEIEPWRANLTEIARRPNVVCKVSGVATEASWSDWNLETITPYLDVAIEAFGARRLLFGSDWPVSLLAVGYSEWIKTVDDWSVPLSDTERERLFAGNAIEAYRLNLEDASE